MDNQDGINQLAKILSPKDAPTYAGFLLGEVISPPPEISIKPLPNKGDKESEILIEKDRLWIAASILTDYGRVFNSTGNIVINDSNCGVTTTEHDGGHQASAHSHGIESININNKYQLDGTFDTQDTLKVGDIVILIPSTDNQEYILVDKAVRL